MFEIDGSRGEGGGQVLRTSLALSALTGRSLRISSIRAGRSNPGLAPQHLTAVRALAALCRAEVQGAELRSQELIFEPSLPVIADDYRFDVADAAEGGSAGSITLLAQAMLPPLAFAPGSSKISLHGGTHVRWSPSFHYLEHVYLPIWRAIGLQVEADLEKWGFYPAGGGQLELEIRPNESGLSGKLDLRDRGELTAIEGVAVASNLPAHIPQRMTDRARNLLAELQVPFNVKPKRVSGAGPGAGIFLTAVYERVSAGFTGHGEPGKPAQKVAEEACQALLDHHQTGVAIDEHLADQILLPLALTEGLSRFSTGELSSHFHTNAELIEELMPECEIEWREDRGVVEVAVKGIEAEPAAYQDGSSEQ